MSPSFLYLAIIAIWALFLVPAWLRRSHAKSAAADEAALDADFDDYPQDQEDADADVDADVDVAAAHTPLAGRGDRPGDPVEFEEDEALGWAQEAAGADPVAPGPVRAVAFEGDHAPARPYAGPEPPTDGDADDADGAAATAGSAAVPPPHRRGYASYQDRADRTAQVAAQRLASAGRSPQSRQQMLRARRRMLTTLALFTIAAAGATVIGLLPWWTIVPPAGMLAIYLLLLREIAIAEAEARVGYQRGLAAEAAHAARAAHAAHAAHAARAARAGARTAYGPPGPTTAEPTAQIIDISGRVGDQLYDQYADAAVRAVGD